MGQKGCDSPSNEKKRYIVLARFLVEVIISYISLLDKPNFEIADRFVGKYLRQIFEILPIFKLAQEVAI